MVPPKDYHKRKLKSQTDIADYKEIMVEPFKPHTLLVDESPAGQISPAELYNVITYVDRSSAFIHKPHYLLLVDVRSQEQYEIDHIVSAIHLIDLIKPAIRNSLKKFKQIVLYSDNDGRPQLAMAIDLLRESEHDIEILNCSYDAFHTRFPFLCTIAVLDTELARKNIPIFPSLIIEDFLYQGTGKQATDFDLMNSMGITHIVNISQEHSSNIENITYHNVRLSDESSSQLLDYLTQIVGFIEQARSVQGRVLVHCNMGISRSSTATLAYLMFTEKCSLLNAFDFLKAKRSIAAPNRGFLLQLGEWEINLFQEQLTDAAELWMTL